ncbi:hypothetical protein KM043_010045 [Ampulex compressa]|nr:hypothetical protein KM043_010045 [Ampulex compressa]
MAPVKRRPARRQPKMKPQRRKPNISKLVYDFLSYAKKYGEQNAARDNIGKCHYCQLQKRQDEVLDSVDSKRSQGKSMGYKPYKDTGRNSKSGGTKNHRISRAQASTTHRAAGGSEKARKYVKRALDFGLESGYLIPSDTYNVLRVSSELMNTKAQKSAIGKHERALSRDRSPRQTPARFEDYEVQDAGRRRRSRRRRGRRRSRSGSKRRRRMSRRRGRKRSRSENPEEAVGGDDYGLDNNGEERNIHAGDVERDPKNARMNSPDGEKTVVKGEDEGTDLSADEDETDEEEEEKKEEGAVKS